MFVHAQIIPVAQTIDSPTTLRSGPSENFDRMAEMPKGLRLQVESTKNDWSKVRLSKLVSGWILAKSLKEVKPGALPSHPVLRSAKLKLEKQDLRMEISESEPGVVLAQEWLHPSVIWFKFQNTQSALFELDYDPEDPLISHVSVWQEFEDVVYMKIDLKAFYGYQMIQKDPEHLIIKFKLAPPKASLKGWKICLDPGHGGKDTGAIGPGGVKEKDVTLQISKFLAELLASKGAAVTFTRVKDEGLVDPEAPAVDELEKRVEAARNNDADLFVSIHCNARPTVREGRVARGSYVYYYEPQSFLLAQKVSTALEQQIAEPKYGVIFRSFHVIREPDFPSILVETAFISNPITEARLRTASYQKKIAQGIFKGILAYSGSI